MWFRTLVWSILLTIALSACVTETVEVTRVKIMERRVIERVEVTVPVTRIHEVVVTPTYRPRVLTPTSDDPNLNGASGTVTPTATATPATPRPTSIPTTPSPSSGRAVGQQMLAALQNMEQTLLSLVQALNSDPLPRLQIIEHYYALQGAPTFDIPAEDAELQSIYVRYRGQVENVLGQSNDLFTHLVQIEAGEADHTEVSPTHLALAQDAASAGTSTIQGLIRELEVYLAP